MDSLFTKRQLKGMNDEYERMWEVKGLMSRRRIKITAPTNLAAATTATHVDLTWDAGTTIFQGGLTYDVFRDGVQITNVADLFYSDEVVDGTYVYAVRSVNPNIHSNKSNNLTVNKPS